MKIGGVGEGDQMEVYCIKSDVLKTTFISIIISF